MAAGRDEGPVYYREIQKNAYLKRIPNETTSKLLPLGHKKPPLKPMWTLFCVHNGRTPFLEQYPEPDSACTLAHKPVWRACLRSARHVTASVRPHGTEYDFLVDTDHGPVRMLAPDWESMQDWVATLRNKLHELKIVPRGENVYCSAPAPPPARAAARDPTSPLPPTPPVPPDRVPGIELTPRPQVTQPQMPAEEPPRAEHPGPASPVTSEHIDISSWETEDVPSTSQEPKVEPKKSVAKICGQNICLDDSILKRNHNTVDTTDSDEELFAEIDRVHDSMEELRLDRMDYKQRLVVNNSEESSQSDRPSNITVIQVSNKPPHTAIPVVGPETQIFNFDFKQNVPVTDGQTDFINIVNTEVNVAENGYGTVFTKESDYGHLSLTTTVNLTGQDDKSNDRTEVKTNTSKDNEGIYERLCMASTSNDNRSPLLSKKIDKIKNADKMRKSSLPNLDLSSTESTYEYLFPNNNTSVTLNTEPHSLTGEVNSNVAVTSNSNSNTSHNNSVVERNTSLSNGTRNASVATVTSTGTVTNTSDSARSTHVNLCNTVSVDLNTRVIRANLERSHSQNAYDRATRRDTIRTNLSPKREEKSDKPEVQSKPIWRRGLTELSLLSRLRGLGQRNETQHRNHADRVATSPVKVVHRSRPRGQTNADTARRRSSSLNNGQQCIPAAPTGALIPLRARQAAALRAEQRRGAAVAASILARSPDAPLFVDYNRQVWVAWWGPAGARCNGRIGDRVAAIAATTPRDAAHARLLLKSLHSHLADILFHRVPTGKIYVINKRDLESIGIKLDNECNIVSVEAVSPAARAGVPTVGPGGHAWAFTEVNNRPINLIKGGEEEMNRMSVHGTEVSVLIQPSPLVSKIRQALKANKHLLHNR